MLSPGHSSKPPFALELRGIVKRFAAVQALAGVTVRVRPKEIHALIGENGAGKSTLMKILDGVYPAGTFEGQIRCMASRSASVPPSMRGKRGSVTCHRR